MTFIMSCGLSEKTNLKLKKSCRTNYTSKSNISKQTCTSEQQQQPHTSESTFSGSSGITRSEAGDFNIRRECFMCGKPGLIRNILTTVSTGTGPQQGRVLCELRRRGRMTIHIYECCYIQICLHMMQSTIDHAIRTTYLNAT